jgi:hypothetical protein
MKDKIDYRKIIIFTKNNLIIVKGSVNQYKAQIFFKNGDLTQPNLNNLKILTIKYKQTRSH